MGEYYLLGQEHDRQMSQEIITARYPATSDSTFFAGTGKDPWQKETQESWTGYLDEHIAYEEMQSSLIFGSMRAQG